MSEYLKLNYRVYSVRNYLKINHFVLLSTPKPTLMEELANRINNDFGIHPDELLAILSHIEAVEPILRKRSALEITTKEPVEDVARSVLPAC